jgi:hypothetical protein
MHRSSLTLLTVIGAAWLAGYASPATPEPVAVEDAHVVGARLAGPLHVVLSGQITCTTKAGFTVYGWVLDRTDGALAKGKTPPKTRPGSPAAKRFKAATTCTGAAQPWSLVATAAGKKPTPFANGQADSCITVYLRKSHHYTDLKQFCASVTIG